MKIYGIVKEYWGGYKYHCDYDEDIYLYLEKEDRDKEYSQLESNKDMLICKFETEIITPHNGTNNRRNTK